MLTALAERFQANSAERELVDLALRITRETAIRYADLAPVKRQWRPLPFFGPLAKAEVITLGLNPSTGEFSKKRNWPAVPIGSLADELVNYFRCSQHSSHAWFQPWETVLADLGLSYASNAAHVDMSPRPTNSHKGKLKPLFIDMLRTDAQIWIEALHAAPKCKVVLAAGAVTNGHFINEFISKVLTGVRLDGPWRRSGEGSTAFQVLELCGRKIPFFFCSSGPKKGPVLIAACRRNLTALRQRLEAAHL